MYIKRRYRKYNKLNVKVRRRGNNKNSKKLRFIDKVIVILLILLIFLLTIYFEGTLNFYNDPSIYDVSKYSINIENMKTLEGLSTEYGVNFNDILTYYSLENNFFVKKDEVKERDTLKRDYIDRISYLESKYSNKSFDKYKELIDIVLSISLPFNVEYKDKVFFINSYDKKDIYNFGKTKSTYFFYGDNELNKIEVFSITSGVIVEIGNNLKSGFYIVVENNDTYITYNYLHNIDENLEVGSTVGKNDFLGYFGNKNYNEFVRLSIDYKVKFNNRIISFNPYPFFCLNNRN